MKEKKSRPEQLTELLLSGRSYSSQLVYGLLALWAASPERISQWIDEERIRINEFTAEPILEGIILDGIMAVIALIQDEKLPIEFTPPAFIRPGSILDKYAKLSFTDNVRAIVEAHLTKSQ